MQRCGSWFYRRGARRIGARALDLGADDVVAVPWTENELLARVRTQLRQKGAVDKLEEKNRASRRRALA